MIKTGILFSKTIKTFFILCATALLGITAAFLFTTLPASAVDTAEKSIDINLTLGNTISVRILDSTATSDLSLLSFDLTPTAAGVTSTKRAIVDVSTSNITGYKLYVEANGKDHNNQYTTDLVQGDTADSHVIPTSTSTASNKNFWNYVNPATSTATVVPAHGNPDQIGYLLEPTTSTKANVDINVGVDTTITAGSYTNQLLFTAIANPESIGYTLNFNSNLPSGADPSTLQNFPANQAVSSSAASYTFTIPSTTPTLTGYDLVHYQNANDSTETYNPGDTVTVNADPSSSSMSGSKTLNAIWSNITYDIAFDANEPSGTTATGSTASMTNLDYNTSYNLTTNGYSITGYSFQGWCTVAVTNPVAGSSDCTSASGTYYADGASVQGLSSVAGTEVTLYAMWTKLYTYTLNLNTNDGTTDKQILNYPSSGGTTDTSHQFTSLNTYAPSRAGYNFLGWATTTTGTSYVTSYTLNSSGAGSTPTADGFPVTGNLYAQWEARYIQNQTYIDQCKTAATGTEFELTDSRDNNVYTVAKLADGKCWMTQNLRLTGSRTLTANDSDVSSNWPLPAETASDFNWGDSCTNTAYHMKSSSTATTYASYGNYYNWYAATAGTGTCSMSSGNATSSICPRGWKLPTGSSSGEFQTLYNNYNSPELMLQGDPAFVRSGYRGGSSTLYQGSNGFYWSSTAIDSNLAFGLYLDISQVFPANGYNKYFGYPVRCVAR